MDVDRDAPVVARAEVEIGAPRVRVWELLSGIDAWPAWNPGVREAHLEGPLEPGSTFRWRAGPGTIVSTIRTVEAPREIAWTGRTLGIDAVHVYRLEESRDRTRVVSEESWSGLPARVLRRRMARSLESSLAAGLARLEAAAER